MVDKCHAVYASLVGVAENHIYVPGFQSGDKIRLVSGIGKNISYLTLRGSDINFILRFLETAVNCSTTCELAETRRLERRCYGLAVVIGGKIYKSMVFAPVDPAVGLLTPYII
nr:hypothetical protein [Bacteroides intestinalis]